jgi:hypothetical protein
MTGMLQAALQWAKRGVPVFPCRMDTKAPMTANGHKDASTNVDIVTALFSPFGEDCLIGARMGAESRLFACDFDLYKPGAKDYMEKLADAGLLTDTQVHSTRSGGLHFVYRSDTDWPNCVPANGVEIKGEGGYIIVPPSAGYSIQKVGISHASAGLIATLLESKRSTKATKIDELKQNVLSGEDFHDSLTVIAARRAASGWPMEKVQQELLDLLNASVAKNPDHPRHKRWAELFQDKGGELSRIAASGAAKYNFTGASDELKATPNNKLDALMNKASALFGTADPREETSEQVHRISGQKALPSVGELTKAWPFESDGYFSTEKRDLLNQKYVMYPLFAERETVLIAAEPKAGKTAIALKMAMAVSLGRSMGTALQIAEPRPCLYFTLEGARAVEMRIEAERKTAEEAGEPWDEVSRLFVVDRPQNFFLEEQQLAVCAKIVAHDFKCSQEFGANLGVIFIDTVTKAMPGGDQNSVEDTSQLFKMIDTLRTYGVTATIVFIHHLSKEGKVRGSSNIEAEVDVVATVEKTKSPGLIRMDIRRARSIDEAINYVFKLTSCYLGTTVQGYALHAPTVSLVAQEELPVVGDTLAAATKWAELCNHLIKIIGIATTDFTALFSTLLDGGFVESKAKRPRADSAPAQKELARLFGGKYNWSFGDYWFGVVREKDGSITGLEIRATK